MDPVSIQQRGGELVSEVAKLLVKTEEFTDAATQLAAQPFPGADGSDPFLGLFTVFILACFIGYYVVWSVTPALHSPLMGVTNAISSVIIVGGLLAAGPTGDLDFAKLMGFMAVTLASINIFGGFIVTQRMLGMFKKR